MSPTISGHNNKIILKTQLALADFNIGVTYRYQHNIILHNTQPRTVVCQSGERMYGGRLGFLLWFQQCIKD